MATAINVLQHEHEAILKMLDVTEKVANRLERGEAVRQEVSRQPSGVLPPVRRPVPPRKGRGLVVPVA